MEDSVRDLRSSCIPLYSQSLLTRYALNYKGLPYKTEWLDTPDIEARAKAVGAPPTRTTAPFYTCPFIVDHSTGAAVSDSLIIFKYLDETYPDSPRLIPEGTEALQAGCMAAFSSVEPLATPFIAPILVPQLSPGGAAHWRKLYERFFGDGRVEDSLPTGEKRDLMWAKLKDEFGKVNAWRTAGAKAGQGPFVTGSSPIMLDLVIAALLIWFRTAWGEDSKEWGDVSKWDGGAWKTLLESLKDFETMD